MHSVEEGAGDLVVGFAYSLACPTVGPDDEELERELPVAELEDVARPVLGDSGVAFRFGYRVRVGVH